MNQSNCLICGSVSKEIMDHLDFTGSKVYYCESCSYWFTCPMPNNRFLENYYDKNYRNDTSVFKTPEYYVTMKRRAHAQLNFIHRIAEVKVGYFKGKKAVDVGCGMGCLLKALLQEGFNAEGFEYDSEIIQYSEKKLKLKINHGGFKAENYHDLDLITLSHVIEHLNDLNLYLNQYRNCLKKNTYLFIEVPNTVKKMFEEKVDQESHLHFFSKKSLSKILVQNGFEVLSCVECGVPIEKAYNFTNEKEKVPFWKKCIYKGMKELKIDSLYCNKTIFDGYYENYNFENGQSGQWLRCLSRKQKD